MRSSKPFTRDSRRGLTLTEVVAGLVLLTTVLSAVFIARGRFLQQWADADRKLRASQAVDAMIGQWIAGPADRVPIDGGGVLAGVDGCQWTTRQLRDESARQLGALIVRLEVTRSGPAVDRGDRLVLAVEFLVPADLPSNVEGTP